MSLTIRQIVLSPAVFFWTVSLVVAPRAGVAAEANVIAAPPSTHDPWSLAMPADASTGTRFAEVSGDTVTPIGSGMQIYAAQDSSKALPGTSTVKLLTLTFLKIGLGSTDLKKLELQNSTLGPGSTDELDQEMKQVFLYVDDGDGVFEPASDSNVAQDAFNSGKAEFTGLNVRIFGFLPRILHVVVNVTTQARDGDFLDALLPDESAVTFTGPEGVETSFPLDPPGGILVDGMAAVQVGVTPFPTLFAAPGSVDNVAFDFTLPGNGYESDQLQQLLVENLGSAQAVTDIESMKLWADGGDGQFDAGAGDDSFLVYGSGVVATWGFVPGAAVNVPPGGREFFISASIAAGAVEGRTLNFHIPGPGIDAVRMVSDNDGILDAAISSQRPMTITASQPIVRVQSESQGTASLLPGGTPRKIFTLRLVPTTAEAETLHTVVLQNASTGAGTPAQLDADWSSLSLAAVRASGTAINVNTIDILPITFSGGFAAFTNLGIEIVPADTTIITFFSGASVNARDGDLLDVRIPEAQYINFNREVLVDGTFPMTPAGQFPVDGMAAAQIQIQSPGATSLLTGTVRNICFVVDVPANGYAADVLKRIDVVNAGLAQPGTDISVMEAWADDGSGVFDELTDTRLGALVFTGKRWQLTGLSQAVPTGGKRIFITCDIPESATIGNTIELVLPTLPDLALGMLSDNDGPRDREVRQPIGYRQTIAGVNRILLFSQELPDTTAHPGQSPVSLLHFLVANTYDAPRTLEDLTFTNATTGTGSQAELDSEHNTVYLQQDGDLDGVPDSFAEDPVVASGHFVDGRVSFQSLGLTLGAASLARFFVTSDVSLVHARDGDRLAAVLESDNDLKFSEAVSFAGSFPIDSNANTIVDGMIAAQVTNFGAPAATLGPSEGPLLAFDFGVPSNGYDSDQLRGVTLVNAGTADVADLSDVRLWRDGGDDTFDAGLGDDVDLGPLSFISGQWNSPLLNEPIPAGGARIFTSISTSATPTDSASIRFTLVTDGLLVDSANDGPIDTVIQNPSVQLLSTAALLTRLEIVPDRSSVGGTVTMTMTVRNAGLAGVNTITPSTIVFSGIGSASVASGPSPATLDLAPGDEATFTWQLQSLTAGEVRASASVSGIEDITLIVRQSLTVTSNDHDIYEAINSAHIFAVESMPFSINRGQTNVAPLALTFKHPGDANDAPVRVDGFRLHLLNDTGGGIVPAELLKRVAVTEGGNFYVEKTSLESSGSEIDFTFTTPVIIDASGGDGQVTLTLLLDVADSTLIPNFKISIPDSTVFIAFDDVRNVAIPVELQESAYPIESGLARVVAEATRFEVTAPADPPQTAARGQQAVPLLRLDVVNADAGGLASDVRLSSFEIQVVDSAGVPMANPGTILDRIQVSTAFQTLLDRPLGAGDDSTLSLVLTPILSVPVNTPIRLTVSGDLGAGASLGTIRVVAPDSASFDARDANTASLVPVLFIAGDPTGPITSIQAPADTVLVSAIPRFPTSTPVGSVGLTALDLQVSHPGSFTSGAIDLESLTLELRDDRGAAVVPATVFDRVRVFLGTSEVGIVTNFPTSGDEFQIPLTQVSVAPGQSLGLTIEADLEAAASVGFLQVAINEAGVEAVDVNLRTPVATVAASGFEFPLQSGLVRIEAPARTLIAGWQDAMPPVLLAGGERQRVATLTLRNPAAVNASTIQVTSLTFVASDPTGETVEVGGVARGACLLLGDALWAEATALTTANTNVTLQGVVPLSIPPGETLTLHVEFDPAMAPAFAAFRLGLESAGIAIEQPTSSLLSIAALAEDGQSFPFWSAAGSFTGSGLRESYSNFPNPFAAGREVTTFAFTLEGSAVVKLQILTSRGEPVVTLIEGESMSAGLHQDRTWDGRNARGDVVVNGVYAAMLDVTFGDGRTARELRKIAVVR